MSSANTVAPSSTSGTSELTILRARPSAIAVLPTPGVADQQRIVLLATAQNLDRALHLRLAADQRIDPPLPRLAVEVDAISVERAFLFLGIAAVFRIFRVARFVLLVGAARQTGRIGMAGTLGDPVADVIHRVVTRHVLLLQEERGMRLALGEDGDKHVGAGHFFAARGLNVERGALDDPLESIGRLRLLLALDDEVFQFRIEVLDHRLAQRVEVDPAGAQDRRRIDVVDQSKQQVLQRRIFVAALVRQRQRFAKGFFERAGENRHGAPHFFSMMHCRGC